jgi:hypothetical protein
VIVKCVEEGAVDEISRPDHGSWPYQEAAGETRETITRAKRGDAEQHLESPSKILAVEQALSQQNIGSVKRPTTVGCLFNR